MIRITWTDPALLDVVQHTDYIAKFNPQAADRLARDLIETADSLSVFPMRGRIGLVPGTQELVAVWPYVLVYRLIGQSVEILRVWHGAQDRGS